MTITTLNENELFSATRNLMTASSRLDVARYQLQEDCRNFQSEFGWKALMMKVDGMVASYPFATPQRLQEWKRTVSLGFPIDSFNDGIQWGYRKVACYLHHYEDNETLNNKGKVTIKKAPVPPAPAPSGNDFEKKFEASASRNSELDKENTNLKSEVDEANKITAQVKKEADHEFNVALDTIEALKQKIERLENEAALTTGMYQGLRKAVLDNKITRKNLVAMAN